MADSTTLFTIGCSHVEAPLALREKLSINERFAQVIYEDLKSKGTLQELLILNTCNRTEIYGVGDPLTVKEYLFDHLQNHSQEEQLEIENLIFRKEDRESIVHALRVACGLESQILGEPEILGQLKTAFRKAGQQKFLGKQLNHLFQKSFQISKWCRTNTTIGTGMVSIGNIIVDLAQRVFGNLEKSSVLLVSAGEVSESAAKALHSRANPRITITNRTEAKADLLAEELQCESLPYSAFTEKLFQYDIIVSSTSSPEQIIKFSDVERALELRKGKPIILIDVAVPRDVDPAVQSLSNVFLYNMDDLAEITQKNLQERERAAELCQQYIDDKAHSIVKKLGK